MRRIQSALLALTLGLSASLIASAHANTDEQLGQLMKKRDFGQVDRLARERLRANPADDAAYNFVAISALSGDGSMREDAIPVIKSCTEKLPRSSRCHHRLGQLYGVSAMSGGMMAAMKYGGQIKDLFAKAVELDPANFEARRDLIQFYLQAPGIVGGSVAKAQEQAEAHARVNAPQGKVLGLDIHIYRKEWDQAEKLIGTLTGSEEASRGALRSATANLGFALINANQLPRAQKIFESAVKQQADYATFHFGLGRALLESKQVDAAIAALERAAELDPAIGAQYRLGIAYQLKGDKARAMANLERFLDVKPPRTGKAADDARQRLEVLKRPA
jgi:tetratricopeptide (TPR) repeat protein